MLSFDDYQRHPIYTIDILMILRVGSLLNQTKI